MTAPLPSRRRGEATRHRLLRAALELFTSTGFQETTTPALAARAGVAEGTIYRHFEGKEHLLNEVFRGAQRWGTGVVRSQEEPAGPAKDRLRQIGRRLFDGAAHDPSLVRMLLRRQDRRLLDERSREMEREFRNVLQEVVAGGKSDAMVRAGPAELWTEVWLALVAFAAERIAAKEWAPDGPPAVMTLDAAWDAIAARAVTDPASPPGP